nr:hypothetical protein [Cytophagales bacterium]
MFKKIMIGFSITYFMTCVLLLLKKGFWIIPEGVLFREEENFFLLFLLFQLSMFYLAGSVIVEKRFQILLMLSILVLSVVLSIREMADVVFEQIKAFSRPLILLALGQGIFALSYLIAFLYEKDSL